MLTMHRYIDNGALSYQSKHTVILSHLFS